MRRNGITYIEKVGKETLQKESKEQEAQDEQLAARMQQQKEIAEAQTARRLAAVSLRLMMEQALLTNTISLPIQLRDMRI